MNMSFREISNVLNADLQIRGKASIDNRDVYLNTDSRSLIEAETFWALKGEFFDGHSFVKEAVKNGCYGAVVENSWFKSASPDSGAFIALENSYQALLDLGKSYAAKFNIPKFAITGSNGKTTTKDMLAQILASKFETLYTKGNLNNHIGVPSTLFGLNTQHQCAVIEMGTNHPGEISTLTQVVNPTVALITNIGYSHVEFLKDLDGVFAEKTSIAEGLQPGGKLIVNGDDPYLNKLESNSEHRVYKVGVSNGDLKASQIELDSLGRASFYLEGEKIHLSVPGYHNVYNAMLATAAAREMGVSIKECAEVLANYIPSSHRMQITKVSELTIFDDCYNANPNSMWAALKSLHEAKLDERKIAIIGDMAELGEKAGQYHKEIGEKIPSLKLSNLICVGELSKNYLSGAIENGFSQEKGHHFENVDALLLQLGNLVQANDAVLIKGSRFLKLERVVEALKREATKV